MNTHNYESQAQARLFAECEKLRAESKAAKAALLEIIRIWEGPREYAAVRFAQAIVKARAALEDTKP